jgi:hypothetical protein
MDTEKILKLKRLLEISTDQGWMENSIYPEHLTIYNDDLNIEIDLMFDVDIFRVRNYNKNTKDKIKIPDFIDEHFKEYIIQFL